MEDDHRCDGERAEDAELLAEVARYGGFQVEIGATARCTLDLTDQHATRRFFASGCLSPMPTNLHGPGDNVDLQTSHVLPAFIRKFHEGKTGAAGGGERGRGRRA